jgi:hypothetical protein
VRAMQPRHAPSRTAGGVDAQPASVLLPVGVPAEPAVEGCDVVEVRFSGLFVDGAPHPLQSFIGTGDGGLRAQFPQARHLRGGVGALAGCALSEVSPTEFSEQVDDIGCGVLDEPRRVTRRHQHGDQP